MPEEPAKPIKRRVQSRRTTPKGGTSGSTPARATSKSSTAPETSKRYTPPTAADLNAPSRLWVPILMFSMLGIGALIIILDYTGALGAVDNIKLIIGLGFILIGIITATQYR